MNIPAAKALGLGRLAVAHLTNAAAEELYLRAGVDLTRPVAVYGIVNERCNYKCQYCEYWRMKEYAEEMTVDDWRRALDGLRDFLGRFHVEFSGGEPFIKRGFLDIVEHCASRGIDWGVTTNGSTLQADRVVRRVVSAGPLNINVSIDSHEPEVHDLARGVPGSHRRLVAGIEALMKERARAGTAFPIILKAVVHSLNFRKLDETVRWAKALGVTAVNFQPLDVWTPETKESLWIGPELQPELEDMVRCLLAQKRAGEPILNSETVLENWCAHFRGEKAPPEAMPCRVGMRNFFIRPEGSVQLCWSFPSIGNVRHASPEAIWRGEEARRRRAETVACDKLCLFTCLSQKTIGDRARMGLRLLAGQSG
jgi:MoaA/NifB/PqqE/SkfB family radical SAM enzyme